jgi:succinate dehydrogenase / fumarate reductase cytochrome b subunit
LGKKSQPGSLYKGRIEGQWSWVFHRITGIAIILFLFAHVVDTAVIGWGPAAYDRVMHVYANWVVRLLEYGLVAMVLYHAFNGVRIMVFDFWPEAVDHHETIFYVTITAYVIVMIPVSYIMLHEVVKLAGL